MHIVVVRHLKRSTFRLTTVPSSGHLASKPGPMPLPGPWWITHDERPADCVPARRSADVPPPDPVDLPEPAGETAPVGLTLASW